jgi:hypothetical protein
MTQISSAIAPTRLGVGLESDTPRRGHRWAGGNVVDPPAEGAAARPIESAQP